jgi:hypothetical protein
MRIRHAAAVLLIQLSLLQLSSPFAFADTDSTDEKPDFQVEVDPAVYPAAEFEGKGVKSGNLPPRVKRPDALPDKGNREAAFARVPDLAPDLAGMDELARDLLFVRAKNYTLKELKAHYPKIDPKKLSLLRKECSK